MNDLYSLNKKIKDLYDKIPLYDRDKADVNSPEKDAYNKAVSEFLECGQSVFEDESLELDQVIAKMNQYSISSVKELLKHEPKDILSAIRDMDNVEEDAFMRLEYCLACKKDDPRSFYEDDMFAEDRAYLAAFSEAEIANFEAFQNYIRTNSDDVVKGK